MFAGEHGGEGGSLADFYEVGARAGVGERGEEFVRAGEAGATVGGEAEGGGGEGEGGGDGGIDCHGAGSGGEAAEDVEHGLGGKAGVEWRVSESLLGELSVFGIHFFRSIISGT